jgi:hypothetical protein
MQINDRKCVESLALRASQVFKDEPVICGKALAAIVKLGEDGACALSTLQNDALEVALRDIALPSEGAELFSGPRMRVLLGWSRQPVKQGPAFLQDYRTLHYDLCESWCVLSSSASQASLTLKTRATLTNATLLISCMVAPRCHCQRSCGSYLTNSWSTTHTLLLCQRPLDLRGPCRPWGSYHTP